jgi:hypothetical protein
MNGTMVCLKHPALDSFNSGNLNPTTVLNFPGARAMPVSRNWRSVTWFPIDEANHEYDDNPSTGGSSDHSLMILLNADTGTSFEIEFYGHYEVIGLGAREVSPSWSSPKTESFLDSLNNKGSMIDPQLVRSALMEAGVAVGNAAIGWAMQYGSSYIQQQRNGSPRIREIE